MRVVVVGAGHVSAQYRDTLVGLPDVTLVAVVDRTPQRAAAFAAAVPGIRVLTLDDALTDDGVDLVLNITPPGSHDEVTTAALAAGRAVVSEKPFTLSAMSAAALADRARQQGIPMACAPDTVLGTGVQTARRLVDDGAIGRPVSALATMISPGHERWHPRPEFFYRTGGGPLFDMGPYHLSALVQLLGPVRRVIGAGSRLRPIRSIGRGPHAGNTFEAQVDTHETGLLLHHSGAISTLVMSFDSVGTTAPDIEIHGTEGALVVPDPNHFDGAVRLRHLRNRDWSEIEVLAGYVDAGRGVGLVDLVRGIAENRPPRATAELAAHVVEIIEALHSSAAGDGTPVDLRSAPDRPDPVPLTHWRPAH